MPRRDGRYELVYVSRPREVVYELPRRSATSGDFNPQSHASLGRDERPRRHHYGRDTVVVSETSDDYGSDAYYRPSRATRDSPQSTRPATEGRRAARFVPAPDDYQRRRGSSDDYVRRRLTSPDDDARGERGRRDDRRSSPSRRLRSAMRGSRNESPEAQRRVRGRSVSFREMEASKHDAGNQKHERPGYEARAMGQYLRHDDDDNLASETYATRRKARRDIYD